MRAFIRVLIGVVTAFYTLTAVAQLDFGPGQAAQDKRLDSIVAVVNDDIITRVELDQALAFVRQQIAQRGTEAPPDNVLERQVLERLISEHLQERAAERSGIVVDDQTLNAAMDDVAKRNRMTLSQLREAYEQQGGEFSELREDIRKQVAIARLRQREVDSRIQVSEQEVDNWLNRNSSLEAAREYHIAQILIALPDAATPEQIEAARNKGLEALDQLRQGADFASLAASISDGRQALQGGDLGWLPVERLPSIFANIVPRLRPGEVSNLVRSPSGFHIVKLLEARGAGAQNVTQTRARHILIQTNETVSNQQARQSLLRLRERVANGEDFNELARAHSNDPGTAARGGELGWISSSTMVPNFEEVMNRLEPGQISEPFQTRFGWHIVQVLERRQGGDGNEVQRAAAREALFRRKSDEEWEAWLRRLQDEAYIEIRL